MKLPLGLILVMAGQAYADEDHGKDEDRAFLTAVQKHDAAALAAMVVVPFRLENVPFKTADCKKKLGGAKVIAKDAKQLVACLAQVAIASEGGFEKWNDVVDERQICRSNAMIGGYDASIELMLAGGHPYHVISLTMKPLEGEVGGQPGGYKPLCAAGDQGAPPPPPPPPAPPNNVPPTLLESVRVAGDKAILPDAKTKEEIVRSGKEKVMGVFKLCLGTGGEITQVTMLKTTGFPAYDDKIQNTIRSQWKYKPYKIDGKAAPVCTAVTFIYGT